MQNSSSSSANPSGVQGVCPTGWHVPSDAEWTQLTDYCSGHTECVCSGSGDNIAKSLAADHDWHITTGECAVGNDLSSNNITGFSALPAGSYGGSYYFFGDGAYFWSATEHSSSYAYYPSLYYNRAFVTSNYGDKYFGFSVRCVKD